MMKRLATASVAAAMGASALLVAGPASAAADNSVGIVSVTVSTGTVVVNSDKAVPVTAYVKTVNAQSVSIDIKPKPASGDDVWGTLSAGKTQGSKWDTYKDWSKTVEISRKDPTGTWVVNVSAQGASGRIVYSRAFFTVTRDGSAPSSGSSWSGPGHHGHKPKGPRWTKLSLDVSPNAVRKYRKVSIDGRLEAAKCFGGWRHKGNAVVHDARWCGDRKTGWHQWSNVGWKKIDIYFQKRGHSRWERVETVTTRKDGTFHTKVPAYWSGTFKAVYEGKDGLRRAEATDTLKVFR
jgi:hypothetical protein